MTPEQVERLKRVAEAFAEQTPDLAADIRALLVAWEEWGREIAALRDEVVRLRHEVERRKGEVVAAEAKLAKVVEAGDNLQREARVVAVPGTGHLIDAIEMWTSAVLAAARGE